MTIKLYKALLPSNPIDYNGKATGVYSIFKKPDEVSKKKEIVTVLDERIIIVKNPSFLRRLLCRNIGEINKGFTTSSKHTIEELERIKKALILSCESDFETLERYAAPTNKKIKKLSYSK